MHAQEFTPQYWKLRVLTPEPPGKSYFFPGFEERPPHFHFAWSPLTLRALGVRTLQLCEPQSPQLYNEKVELGGEGLV